MLMTSSRPKMIVSPSAIRITATPMESPLTICGAKMNCIASIRPCTFAPLGLPVRCPSGSAPPTDARTSESLALAVADRGGARHLADDPDLAAAELHRVHVLDRLMIAGTHLLRPLRRFPFEI